MLTWTPLWCYASFQQIRCVALKVLLIFSFQQLELLEEEHIRIIVSIRMLVSIIPQMSGWDPPDISILNHRSLSWTKLKPGWSNVGSEFSRSLPPLSPIVIQVPALKSKINWTELAGINVPEWEFCCAVGIMTDEWVNLNTFHCDNKRLTTKSMWDRFGLVYIKVQSNWLSWNSTLLHFINALWHVRRFMTLLTSVIEE